MVKNLKDLMKRFSTEKKCIEYLVQQRWDGVPTCPYCGSQKSYVIEGGKRFKCGNNQCYKKYSVTVGTVYHASNVPLTTWLPAQYIILSHKKGISSCQLARDLGVTQKAAWFMLHRIREQLKADNSPLLKGLVEIDETYMGRKFGSEYKGIDPEKVEAMASRPNSVNKLKKRGAVVGIADRDTKNIRVFAFEARTADVIKKVAETNIHKDATIFSDEALLYRNALKGYDRETVNHFMKEWVRGNIHVNTVENFWGCMKRGVYGIYHQISYKHLQAYCNEYSFRYNSRKINDGDRFTASLRNLEGRLTYKQLVHGKSQKESS